MTGAKSKGGTNANQFSVVDPPSYTSTIFRAEKYLHVVLLLSPGLDASYRRHQHPAHNHARRSPSWQGASPEAFGYPNWSGTLTQTDAASSPPH
jgi:hypothetical protein